MKAMQRPKLRFTIRFYLGDTLKFTTTQTAFSAATAALMAEQILLEMCPAAKYDRYDIQWAA